MEISEVFQRIILGHLRLLAVAVFAPLIVLFATRPSGNVRYIATARLQASGTAIGSDTEADSVLNRVKGIATSTAIIEQASSTAGLSGRDPVSLAAEISVTRLGSSAIVDISVTDRSAATARALSSALATGAVAFISQQGGRQQALVSQFEATQKQLYDQRQTLIEAQTRAGPNAVSASTTAQLSTVDQELADLSATLRQLQVAAVTDSSAGVISPAYSATRVHTSLRTKFILGAIAGLVAGLLVAALLEAARPRVADARAFARELEVPLVGGWRETRTRGGRVHHAPLWPARLKLHRLRRRPNADEAERQVGFNAETLVAIRRGAASLKVTTLVLVGERNSPDVADLAARMTAVLRGDSTASLNGRGKVSLVGPSVSTGSGALRTLAPPTTAKEVRTLSVLRLTDIEALDPDTACALLVVARKLTPYSRLQWIRDLATTTGWPILGVLDSRGGNGSRR